MDYGMMQKIMRIMRDMKQGELAFLAETTQERISDFEIGRRLPPSEEETRIKDVLGWTTEADRLLLELWRL